MHLVAPNCDIFLMTPSNIPLLALHAPCFFRMNETMQHWVFDLDGTLVDSFSHYFAMLERIFMEHGVRFTEDLRYAALTETLDQFFAKHLGKDAVPQALADLQKHCNQDAQSIRAFDGMIPALKHLTEKGARIAVWTNRDYESAKLILEHSGLEPFAEVFVSGTCVQQRKPHPEGLLRIIDAFGCTPDSVTMIGDHEHDVAGAKSIGARAVRASWHSYWSDKACSKADLQFHRVQDFTDWIKKSS